MPADVDRTSGVAFARSWSADALAVLALVFLTAVLAWDRLRDGRGLIWTDPPSFYLPWFTALGDRIRAFDVPGWSSAVFSGAPFAGDPQAGWMYLPAMVFFTVLPPIIAYKVLVVFHLVFAGLSAYALGRVLGLGAPAAAVAGAAYEFGPLAVDIGCCTGHAQVITWIPLSLLGIEGAIRARSWSFRILCWSGTGFAISQWLASWIGQGAAYGLLVVGGYVVYRTVFAPRPDRDRWRTRFVDALLHVSAVVAMGFGLAGAGVLTRLEVASRSNLADGYAGSHVGHTGWGLAGALERTLGDAHAGRWYVGGATVSLAIVAPLLARRRFGTPFFVVLSALAFILALKQTPIHQAFFWIPKFEVLHGHVPNRVLMILNIGLALLAGIAVKAATERRRRPWVLVAIAPVPLIAFALAVVYSRNRGEEITSTTWPAVIAVTVVLVAFGVSAVVGPGERSRIAAMARVALPVLLVLVMFWDTTGRWYGDVIPGTPADAPASRTAGVLSDQSDDTLTGAARFIADNSDDGPVRHFGYDIALARPVTRPEEGYRLGYRDALTAALLINNRAVPLGLQDVQGYNPFQIDRYVQFIAALNGTEQDYHETIILPSGLDSPLLDLLNVRYIVVPAGVPPGRPDLLHLSQRHPTVYDDGVVRVLERPTPLPRAWIVHEARQMTSTESLAAIASGSVDPRTTATLEATSPDLASAEDPGADSVEITEYDDDRITLRTTTDAAGLLTLSEVYDPGWRAYVDGTRVDVLRADFLFRAVPIPAGLHEVELRYEPASLRIGMAMTAGTTAIIASAGIWWLAERRGWSFAPGTARRILPVR